ncbi:MAG: hypothetical protein H6556_32230 [Lewinellaceae bacterium]|nr:hypothetical protein [Lewinellaceae bacterium]
MMTAGPTPQNALHRFVAVREQLQRPKINGSIEGTLTLDAATVKLLKALAADKCVDPAVSVFEPEEYLTISALSEIHEGRPARVRLYPNKLAMQGYKYFESLDELITGYNHRPPEVPYYIHGLRYFSTDAERPEMVSHYYATIKLIGLLKEIADFHHSTQNLLEIFFFDDSKLNIITGFSKNDLQPLPQLAELERQFNEPADKKERRIIFRSVLFDQCQGIAANSRFRVLLKEFPLVLEKYFQSIELYLKGFNITRLKSEFQEKKLKFLHDIFEVVAGIHSKLISIPLAVFLLVYSFDITGQDLFKNLALLAASFAFSFLFDILLQSQIEQLESLGQEIEKFREDSALLLIPDKTTAPTGGESPEPAASTQSYFQKAFDELQGKRRQRSRLLNLLGIISWSVCLSVAFLFLVFQIIVPVIALQHGIFALF